MMLLKRVFLICLKLFLLLVVAGMIRFQIPELRYDFGAKEPVRVESVDELSMERFGRSTFASVRGRADLGQAATFAKYGVRYTYFLLDEYGARLVVRTGEPVSEDWTGIDSHMGRLRPFHRMPFSRSVRAGFRKLYDVDIPRDAFFLARDDVPRFSGWSTGAVVFAGVMWCVMAYFFFVHGRIAAVRGKKGQGSAQRTPSHHAQPEPACDQPGDDG